MAEIFVGAVVQVLIEKLALGGISQFLKLVKANKIELKNIHKWQKNLKMIAALLSDAEQRQIESNAVKLWLEDLQDLAYDLEDIVDDFATEAQLHQLQKIQDDEDDDNGTKIRDSRFLESAKYRVKSILACGSSTRQHFQYCGGDLSSRIEDISSRLQHIQTQAGDLGLSARSIIHQETPPTEAPKGSWRQSTSLVCEPVVYGRDDKRNEIIENFLKDEPGYENVVVIPIVGMGGIGKMTLAQYIYNDELQLKSHFCLKAWVCVSDVFDVTRVTTDIINSFTKKNHNFSNLNQAQENLVEMLKGKKFLIVLDDIWSENYSDWNRLQTPFRQGLKGSRVIVTTRKDITARIVTSNPTHSTTIYLKGLSDDDCWRIFQQHSNYDSDFAEVRDDVTRKCKGLPLAAKALGGLLKSTVEKNQRRKILESNIWSEESSVLPALRLSYYHLPPHLKRIFAYCSLLPKDYKFKEMEVVLLWMAQGFIPENNQERMEDVGHNYFFDLVSRSLFEECSFNDGESRKFTMHDLVHDLAEWAVGDLCCLLDTMNMQKDLRKTRHLFLTENSSSRIEELPECIGGLKHLRFLTLHFIKIKVLPKSVSKLCNLQTLFLRGCGNLEEVPNIRFLVNLRYLDIDGTSLLEMPPGIEKLVNLQNLQKFVLLAGRGSRVRDLKNLNHLHGKLRISGLENVSKVEDAQEAQLCKKYGLDELLLEWGTCRDEVDDNIINDVLEEMQPHTSIKKFVLQAYRGLTIPAWLGDPSFTNMVNIQLVNCKNCEWLPPLGQLPSLKNLWVEDMDGIKQVGLEFYGRLACSSHFPALRDLCFKGMKSWEKWSHTTADNNRAFPCLEELSIIECFSLQGDLPPHFPSLQILKIKECGQLSISLPSLPLLEDVVVNGCKVLSTTADVIFCSKRMFLWNILEIVGLPGCCPYLSDELSIFNCQSLITIDQIPLSPRRLNIRGCQELESVEFEDSSSSSSSLEELSVNECKSIIAIGQIPLTLRQLEIFDCQKLQIVEFKEVPCFSCNGKEILGGQDVNWSTGCDKKTLKTQEKEREAEAESVGSLEVSAKRLRVSSMAPSELVHLTYLTIIKCPSLISLQEGLLLPCLEELDFFDCENLEGLPNQMHNFTSLQHLNIKECPKIRLFSEGGLPKSLSSIEIEEVNIKLPVQDWGLHLLCSLQSLLLYNVGSSADSADCLTLPSSLSELRIKGFQILKTTFCHTLPNLTLLWITDCPKFCYFQEGGSPRNLRSLSICSRAKIDNPIREWGLQLLTSLESLTLKNVGSSIDNSLECIPGPELYLPSSLAQLNIKGFSELKSICCSILPNLTQITIKSCPKFESFGDNNLPLQLESVHIKECDLIEHHLKSDPRGRIYLSLSGRCSLC